MLRITQRDYQEACQIGTRQMQIRLKGLASQRVNGVKYYALPDALATLPAKYAHTIPALLARAVEDAEVSFVGGDGDLQATEALERLLVANINGAAYRISQVRKALFYGLGQAVRSSSWMTDAERLRVLIMRDSGCLAYVITGNPATLPRNWPEKARVFALLHSAVPLPSEFAA